MIQAGELIHTEWEEEMSVDETSSLDRFFASVHESPQKLARVRSPFSQESLLYGLAVHCSEVSRRGSVSRIEFDPATVRLDAEFSRIGL